jgi:hypothetical protein
MSLRTPVFFLGAAISFSGGGDCFVVPPRKDMQFDILEGVQFIKITFTDC